MSSRLMTIILIVGAIVCSGVAKVSSGEDVLSKLRVSEAVAKEYFVQSLWNGTVFIPGGSTVFKAESTEGRVAIVRALAKSYCQTEDFRLKYAQLREENKPKPPEAQKPMSEQLAEMRKELEKSIAEMRESMKSMPPDVQKEMEKTIAQMKAQQEASEKDVAMQAQADALFKEEYEAKMSEYEQAVKKYEAEYPKDPSALIARRLKEFLTMSATIDFGAKLVPVGNLMRFADPALESKPREWKLCFRAGKEVVEAARAFAAAWLKELR